jgi:hypothetical protein
MKSAMQELIDWLNVKIEILENEYSMSIASGIRAAKMEAEKLLEKEKEQIEDAYLKGYIHYLPKIDSKEYYKITYDQNQHIIDIMKADEDDGLYKIFDTNSDKKH